MCHIRIESFHLYIRTLESLQDCIELHYQRPDLNRKSLLDKTFSDPIRGEHFRLFPDVVQGGQSSSDEHVPEDRDDECTHQCAREQSPGQHRSQMTVRCRVKK
ncbi:hypothetical protein L505_0543 [Bordetella bronchiseptica F4563]|nr:hypothetical protein L505_0543 [Bordetella bronchiseptica F4563]